MVELESWLEEWGDGLQLRLSDDGKALHSYLSL